MILISLKVKFSGTKVLISLLVSESLPDFCVIAAPLLEKIHPYTSTTFQPSAF